MSTTAATKCDRCGVTALGYPSDWGTVRMSRAKPFVETGEFDLCASCFKTAYELLRLNAEPWAKTVTAKVIREDLVLVHADGGSCHGTRLVNNQCPKCGIVPDMQSTELWPQLEAK
jgi:hypothetical protein